MDTKFLSYTGLQEYDDLIKAYVDTGLSGKSGSTHTHDGRYYTETEIDAKFDAIPESTMVVTFTKKGSNTLSSDKTIAEILEAHNNGTNVVGFYLNSLFVLSTVGNNRPAFVAYLGVWSSGTDGEKLTATAYRHIFMYDDSNIYYQQKIVQGLEIDRYNSLTTTQKTVIGAINELDEELGSHTHDDLYYTETEIDGKLSAINTSIGNITSGSTPVKEAEHADSATSSLDAEKLGGQLPSYYAKASDIPTGALAKKNSVSESDLDTALAEKVNAASEGNHSHLNKTVLDGITSAKVSAWDSAESNAKTYADNAATTAANKVKNDLLNGAGTAYDTLKELGELIDDNKDAIDALEDIASGKANATHGHAIADVSGLQSALDGKAASSHGTHVTFDSTNKPKMDGTAAFGTSTKVARADHVHPTDTSRAAKSDFDTHVASTVSHVTANERTAWNAKASTASATTATAGLMSAADKTKLNGIAEGANKYTHPTTSGNKHIPSGGTSGQFLKWSADGTAVWAADNDTKYAAGAGIALSGTTFSNSGVRSVVTGTTNGTIIVNTNGATASVPVKGLGNAAYTSIDTALSSTSTNSVQNKVVNSAITSLTSSVTSNTNSISTLTSAIGAFEEITSADIAALFS